MLRVSAELESKLATNGYIVFTPAKIATLATTIITAKRMTVLRTKSLVLTHPIQFCEGLTDLDAGEISMDTTAGQVDV